jgi:hypothetical protein
MSEELYYDPELAGELGEGVQFGSGVELPFATVFLRALNGKSDPIFKQNSPVRYYGGWTVGTEDLESLAEVLEKKIPAEFAKTMMTTQQGKEYEAYASRFLYVAPIGLRKSYIDDDNGRRSPEFFWIVEPDKKRGIDGKAARLHVQVLCMLGTKTGTNPNKWEPFGPVVLTAKGFGMAPSVTDAFSNWNRASYNARRKFSERMTKNKNTAPAPAWIFYLKIGTFGDKRVTKTVGKTTSQDVTPMFAQIPEDIPDALIDALYVGRETMALMKDLQEQAQKWLHAWDKPLNENEPTPKPAEHANAGAGYEEPPFDAQEPGGDFDDEIPF